MAKILFSADWHIVLGQKNVPKDFQRKRFFMLVDKLNEAFEKHECDLHIIGGDILDKFSPSVEELELYFELIAKLQHKTYIYTGNHEMISKTKSVLDNIKQETSRCNPLVTVVSSVRSKDFDIIDYKELHKKKWAEQESDIVFTHVRGSIPPHVEPEIDLTRFDGYRKIFSGDLHSSKNTQVTPSGIGLIYPGSPLMTSFHRNRLTDANGYLVIDTYNGDHEWYSLAELPQLIRKTVNAGEDMPKGEYDRYIYEVVGDLSELKQVDNTELLDKKIHKNIGTEATLNLLENGKVSTELLMWMKQVEQIETSKAKEVMQYFREVINEDQLT